MLKWINITEETGNNRAELAAPSSHSHKSSNGAMRCRNNGFVTKTLASPLNRSIFGSKTMGLIGIFSIKSLYSKGLIKWALRDSNPRPIGYEPTALTN